MAGPGPPGWAGCGVGAAFLCLVSSQESCSRISHLSPSISLTGNSGKSGGVPLSGAALWKCRAGDEWQRSAAPRSGGGRVTSGKICFLWVLQRGGLFGGLYFKADDQTLFLASQTSARKRWRSVLPGGQRGCGSLQFLPSSDREILGSGAPLPWHCPGLLSC